MGRLDKEREEKLTPKRVEYAVNLLKQNDLTITYIGVNQINFIYNGNMLTLFPYSGWFTGKGIKDGRGVDNLINQIKK